MLTFVNILLTGILCLSDFPSNIIKKCAAGFFAQNLEIAAFASQNEKRTFFCKEKVPPFEKWTFIFVLFFGVSPFLFPIFIEGCGT